MLLDLENAVLYIPASGCLVSPFVWSVQGPFVLVYDLHMRWRARTGVQSTNALVIWLSLCRINLPGML